MSLEQDSQENHVRFQRFLQRPGNDRGSDRLRLWQQRFGRAPAGDGDFDVVAGESAGEGLAYRAETDDCVAHDDDPFRWGVSGLARSGLLPRSEEHTSELQSLMRISYAVFCLTNKKKQ